MAAPVPTAATAGRSLPPNPRLHPQLPPRPATRPSTKIRHSW